VMIRQEGVAIIKGRRVRISCKRIAIGQHLFALYGGGNNTINNTRSPCEAWEMTEVSTQPSVLL
jgi:hypothetical protein